MHQIQQQLDTIRRAQRAIGKAMDEVAPGGRLCNATDEAKCTRLWGAISGARAMMIDRNAGEECITTIIRTLTSTAYRYERGLETRICTPDRRVSHLMDGARYALIDITAAQEMLNNRLEEESRSHLEAEDEWAIRRAVWSRALATNLQDCHCPYPVGHAHREIWLDELMILCKEHCDLILNQTPPPAPVAEELDMGEALDIFGMLPLCTVVDGEFVEDVDVTIKDCAARLPAIS